MKKNKLTRAVGKWQPWDYGFNLDMEKAMFEKQAEYFVKSGIAEGDKRRFEICSLLVKLLNIITGRDSRCHLVEKANGTNLCKMIRSTKIVDDVYINKRNAGRFFDSVEIQFLEEHSGLGWHDLREAKAWYLYNKLRYYQMKDLWN